MRPVRSASVTPLSVDSTSPPAELHFGILLRRARERRGFTVQNIAEVTRIADRWISSLEEARLDLLPAPVFVIGYVRSYARTVGLDEQDLVDRYHALTQQRGSLSLGTGGQASTWSLKQGWRLMGVLIALALVLLGIAGIFLLRNK